MEPVFCPVVPMVPCKMRFSTLPHMTGNKPPRVGMSLISSVNVCPSPLKLPRTPTLSLPELKKMYCPGSAMYSMSAAIFMLIERQLATRFQPSATSMSSLDFRRIALSVLSNFVGSSNSK